MNKSFEGGRGLAAVLVALFHLSGKDGYFSLILHGYLFVDLFFVLSGYLMCSLYADKLETEGALRPFVIRRFGRLFPLHAFTTVLFFASCCLVQYAGNYSARHGYANFAIIPERTGFPMPAIREWLATFSMAQGLGYFNRNLFNSPSWSISTEFYTYLVFAVLALLLRGKVKVAVFATLTVLTFAFAAWGSINVHNCLAIGKCLDVTYDFGFPRCIADFFLGALTFYGRRLVGKWNVNAMQAGGMILLSLLFAMVGRYPVVAFAFPLTFALLVFSVISDRGPLARMLGWGPFQMLGQRSFSIYLTHTTVMVFYSKFKPADHGGWAFALYALGFLAIVLVVSDWTYRFVEDPYRIKFNRWASGSARPPAVVNG